jgi:hypothetical protein
MHPQSGLSSQCLICCRTFVRQVTATKTSSCDTNALCLSDKIALLQNVRTGLIDPDTPSSAKTKTAADGTKMSLVVCLQHSSVYSSS